MAAAERLANQGFIPELPGNRAFLNVIGRPDVKEVLRENAPFASISMENDALGGAYAGGLGILEGDKFHQAVDSNIPYLAITFSPPERWRQRLVNFWSTEESYSIHPKDNGFRQEPISITINANGDQPRLEVYSRQVGSAKILTTYEDGLRGLYHGATDSEHRLYQKVVLGVGGFKATRELKIKPPVVAINESPAVFYSLAELNQSCEDGKPFSQGQAEIQDKTTYINHTLEQAAEAEFNQDQFDRYVFRNMGENVINWLSDMIARGGGRLKLSTLALALSKRHLGVSLPHAQIASEQFRDIDGKNVSFDAITNGVHSRWVHRDFLRMDRENGVIDEFGLPRPDFSERIFGLDPDEQRQIKNKARQEMREYLPRRLDQYGNPIHIPEDSKTVGWARRPVPYKRPEMPFDDPSRLAEILESENIHFLFAGKVPSMGGGLQEILNKIDKNPILRARVHYIQDYEKELASHLVAGTDMWLNTPIVGKEACGTSGFKVIRNRGILISTEDGGIADIRPSPALIIRGGNRQEEAGSLYNQLQFASRISDERASTSWNDYINNQSAGYIETASAARNLKDTINYAITQQKTLQIAA